MSKKFTGCQILGDRPTIDGNKRRLLTIALSMNQTGYVLFTGTTFSGNQYSHHSRSYQSNIFVKFVGFQTRTFDVWHRLGLFCPLFLFGNSSLFQSVLDLFQNLVRNDGLRHIIESP